MVCSAAVGPFSSSLPSSCCSQQLISWFSGRISANLGMSSRGGLSSGAVVAGCGQAAVSSLGSGASVAGSGTFGSTS